MRDIILLIGGGYIGWWLALNKEAETRKALNNAQSELSKVKDELVNQIEENKFLQEKGVV